jgi:hypothetical protein
MKLQETSEHVSWRKMKERCYTSSCPDYKNYGAKGITICDSWRFSYDQFFKDMGPKPEGYTIDRIDGSLDYFKENCRWSSKHTQALNRDFIRNAKGVSQRAINSFRARYNAVGGKQVSKTFKTEAEAREWYLANRQVA